MPPNISTQMLDHFDLHASGARIPTPENHFNSLAYHALYHKGFKSGLPSRFREHAPDGRPSKYLRELNRLAEALDLNLDLSMESLDEYLATIGWRPTYDALVRYSYSNLWLEKLLLSEHVGPVADAPNGVVAFLIREATSDADSLNVIRDHLTRSGFTKSSSAL